MKKKSDKVTEEQVNNLSQYNKLLKRKHDYLNKDILKYETLLTELDKNKDSIQVKYNDEKIRYFSINVLPVKPKIKLLKRIKIFIFGKDKKDVVHGYVFYMNKNRDLKLYELKDNIDVFTVKHDTKKETEKITSVNSQGTNESYMLHNYFGTYNNKPFFFIKFPYAISLDLYQETNELDELVEPVLAYDSKAYYNLFEHVLKRKITQPDLMGPAGMGKFISDNLPLIVIMIIAVLVIMSPQGQQFLKGIVSG